MLNELNGNNIALKLILIILVYFQTESKKNIATLNSN